MLNENKLDVVYMDGYIDNTWDNISIGYIVENVDDITQSEKDNIRDFCSKYNWNC